MNAMRLIDRVLALMFPLRPSEETVAEISLESIGEFFAPLHTSCGAIALLPYRVPEVMASIREAKFRGNLRAQQLLGSVLREYLEAFLEDRAALSPAPVIIVPVPLSHTRRRERGYNQAEEIARLARVPGANLQSRLLARTRNTEPQTNLAKSARRQNMAGAFRASGDLDPGSTYIIVDDVVTTGATLLAAREALLQAGALHVELVALAH